MAKVWKIFALLAAITALVWLTTLWRWQSANVDPSSGAIALNLLALPLGLTAAVLAAMWSVRRLQSYAQAPLPPPTPSAPPAADVAAAPQPQPHFMVLAAKVALRAGDAWDAACDSIGSGDCKAELDAELQDDDGVAVFSARMPELDTGATEESIDELLQELSAKQPEVWGAVTIPADFTRAMALLSQTLDTLHEPLEAQWEVLKNPRRLPAPTVSIRVAIPARWPDAVQQLARAWITQQVDPLLDAGLLAAGQSRAMAQTVVPVAQLQIHAVENAEAFWLMLDHQLTRWHREGASGLLLAMAADSFLSAQHVEHLAATQTLFSGSNSRGLVPGEGAAALLLASPLWPHPTQADPVLAHMRCASVAQRAKSADEAGRVSALPLQQAAADAIQGGGVEAATILHVTTDADHRGSRTGEVLETLQELLPHLDAMTDALRLGAGCGDLGIARLLACAALSANKVQSTGTPVMVLGAFPALERFALVMTPPPSAPGEASAAPAA